MAVTVAAPACGAGLGIPKLMATAIAAMRRGAG